MIENNIFQYATKELTQDAILCYIFEGYRQGNKTSENFIKKFIFKDIIEKEFEITKIGNIKCPNRCYGNIDISLEIELDNCEKYLVLIENKTETFLHPDINEEYNIDGKPIRQYKDGQLKIEIKKALEDFSKQEYNIIYILFKTKGNYAMQYYYNFRRTVEELREKIDMNRVKIPKPKCIKDFITALDDNSDDIILEMAKEYYKGMKEDNILLSHLDEKQVEILDNEIKKLGAVKFFRPAGISKQDYRTSISIGEKVKDNLKTKNLGKDLEELLNRSHYELNINWAKYNKIFINIYLNICEEEDCNYLSYKKLIIRDKKRYERKSENRVRLIEFINTNINDNQYYKKSEKGKNSLQILKYEKECSINNNLVEEIKNSVFEVYNKFIQLLEQYILENAHRGRAHRGRKKMCTSGT